MSIQGGMVCLTRNNRLKTTGKVELHLESLSKGWGKSSKGPIKRGDDKSGDVALMSLVEPQLSMCMIVPTHNTRTTALVTNKCTPFTLSWHSALRYTWVYTMHQTLADVYGAVLSMSF